MSKQGKHLKKFSDPHIFEGERLLSKFAHYNSNTKTDGNLIPFVNKRKREKGRKVELLFSSHFKLN